MTEKATTEATLGGLVLPAGTEVSMGIGSANRDPERFADPDSFDIDRDTRGQMAFGYRVHFYIGQYVARVLTR